MIQCGMEQLVARRAHNPKVTGSSPVPATKGQTGVMVATQVLGTCAEMRDSSSLSFDTMSKRYSAVFGPRLI